MHTNSEDQEKALKAKAIIEKDCRKHYTYYQLSKSVGTNPTKLQADFKIITGKSLYQYLTSIRIEKAANLLETTSIKVDAIACKVGLDRTNLNKQFKKLKGKSPTEWRRDRNNKGGHFNGQKE